MDSSNIERKKTPPPREAGWQRELVDAHVTPSGAVKRRRRSPTPEEDDGFAVDAPETEAEQIVTPKCERLHGFGALSGPTPVKGSSVNASPFSDGRKFNAGIRTPAANFMARLLEPNAGKLTTKPAADKALFPNVSPSQYPSKDRPVHSGNNEVIEAFDEAGIALTGNPVYEPLQSNRMGGTMAVESSSNPVGSAQFVGQSSVPAVGPTVYGRLVVLGHRETRPFLVCKSDGVQYRKELQFDRNATFVLRKQVIPNGFRLVDAQPKSYTLGCEKDQMSHAESSSEANSEDDMFKTIRIAGANHIEHRYTFKRDFSSRLFQFGRAREHNDFVVLGKNNEITVVEGSKGGQTVEDYLKEPGWNASSRYAFRIVHQDDGNGSNRVFAAGFDESQDIFFGERALKVQSPRIDGFTTYGLYIWKPSVGFWMEISAVHGDCFMPRESRDTPGKRLSPTAEHPYYTNELEDGSLLWNAKWTVMWKSTDAPAALTDADLKQYRSSIGACMLIDMASTEEAEQKQQTGMSSRASAKDFKRSCSDRHLTPITEITIPNPQLVASAQYKTTVRPYIYSDCGHVVRIRKRKHEVERMRKCPACGKTSTLAPLVLYPVSDLVSKPPTHAFVPCGHAVDEAGKARWESVKFPKEVENLQDHEPWCINEKYRKQCPFCAACFTSVVSLSFTTANVPVSGDIGIAELEKVRLCKSTSSSALTLYENNATA